MKLIRWPSAAIAGVLVGLLLLPGSPRGAAAQSASRGMIAGVVTDTGLKAVQSAEVQLFGTNIRLLSDARGRFKFTGVPAKEYMLTVRRLGYLPAQTFIEVKGGDTLRLSYELVPTASALGAVTVTGKSSSIRLQEFEDRRSLGVGEFFTAEEMEKRGAIRVADVLRQSKTVDLVPSRGGRLWAMSKRPAIGLSGECPMQVFLDGAPYSGMPDTGAIDGNSNFAASTSVSGGGGANVPPPPGLVQADPHKAQPVDLNSLVTAKELAGMEVYGGASTIPVQYNTGPNRMCGVILLWTKDR